MTQNKIRTVNVKSIRKSKACQQQLKGGSKVKFNFTLCACVRAFCLVVISETTVYCLKILVIG